MKRIFYLVLTVFFGCMLMSSSPSLDGRAVVADGGIFPAGLFAKTVGYLPGDSISVTNPSNGQNVDILVIGSLDPSEGVAVMLSPEAADYLGIKKNSNMLVKLTKRSGDLDENANGSCVLTQSNASAVSEPLETAESSDEEVPEEEIIDETETSDEEIIEIEDENVIDETEDSITEETEVIEEPEVTEDEVVVETESVEEDEIPEEAAPVIVDDAVIPEEEGIEEDEIPEEAKEEIPVIEDNYAVPEEEGVEEDEIPEEEKPAVIDDAVIPEEESVEEDEIPEEEKPVIIDDAVIPEEEGIEEDELPPEEEIVEESEETEDFDAIILVPSEENPPETEEAPVEEAVTEEIETVETVETPVEETVPVEKEFEAPVQVTSGEYESGKWYIQIAVYSKQENVNEVIKKYGKKYPLFIDQKNGKNYVLIGPLSMDEYGAVLQRFKAFGYKDAFVKKIK
ncbi:MAG: SPOR domain-containing protein [Treponema sp.]|nr:SPOR domain-containing protein [Candidatus Treponema merdequi]